MYSYHESIRNSCRTEYKPVDGTTDAMIAGLPASIDFKGTEFSIRYQPTSAMFANATLEKRKSSKAVLGAVTLDAQSLELGWSHQFDRSNLSGLQLKASLSAIRRHNEVTLSGLGLALSSDENRLRLRINAELNPHWRVGVASSVRASGDPRARFNVIYLGRMLTERVFLAVRYQDTMSSIGTNYVVVTEEYALTLGTRFQALMSKSPETNQAIIETLKAFAEQTRSSKDPLRAVALQEVIRNGFGCVVNM